jgi:hypothetical protein
VILSLLQSYALFVADTQGSAKPPPWAIIYSALRASIARHDNCTSDRTLKRYPDAGRNIVRVVVGATKFTIVIDVSGNPVAP